MRPALALAAICLLAGCGPEEPDFKAKLHGLTANLHGKVYPLPQAGPLERAVYGGARFPDPFNPAEKMPR